MLFLERIIQEIVLCAVYNECRLNDELSFQEGKNMIRKYIFGEPIETGAVVMELPECEQGITVMDLEVKDDMVRLSCRMDEEDIVYGLVKLVPPFPPARIISSVVINAIGYVSFALVLSTLNASLISLQLYDGFAFAPSVS